MRGKCEGWDAERGSVVGIAAATHRLPGDGDILFFPCVLNELHQTLRGFTRCHGWLVVDARQRGGDAL